MSLNWKSRRERWSSIGMGVGMAIGVLISGEGRAGNVTTTAIVFMAIGAVIGGGVGLYLAKRYR